MPLSFGFYPGKLLGHFRTTKARLVFLFTWAICAVAQPVPPASQPLPRCPDQFRLGSSIPRRINVEIEFDARTGNLQVDNGAPIPPNQCFIDRFVATRQVVTLRVYSKFHMDASVTPTMYTLQEENLTANMPAVAAPGGETGAKVAAAAGPAGIAAENQLSPEEKAFYCALDSICDDTAPQLFANKVAQEYASVDAVGGGFPNGVCAATRSCYRDQAQFERFVSDTQALGSRWTAAVKSLKGTLSLAGNRREILSVALDNLYKISRLVDHLREESEQTTVSALNQPSGNQIVQLQFVVHDTWVPLSFTPFPNGKDEEADAAQPAPPAPTISVNSTKSGAEQHVVRTILLEIHHEVRFNGVGGFYWSTLRQKSFSINPGSVYCTAGGMGGSATLQGPTGPCVTGATTPSGTPTGTPSFPVGNAIETQNSHQLGFMLGFEVYFVKRDLFPGRLTKTMRATPGLLLGGAPGATPSFMLGLNWEPMTGVDFYAGGHYAQVTGLANGINTGTPLPASGTVPTATPYRCCGLFLGAGIDVHVFQSIFSGLLGGGGPGAASNGGGGPGAPATPGKH